KPEIMNKYILTSTGGILLLVLFCSLILERKQTVWMIGDSTMAIKAPEKFPETGWGVAFAEMFRSDVNVINKAKNGRSTKSCIREGIWKEVSDGLRQGDYVFIQFGHNDEK